MSDNRCDSCEALMINGMYCHEIGCPRYAEELRAEKQKDWEEENDEELKNPVLIARQQELAEIAGVSKVYDGRQNINFDDDNLVLQISLVGEYNGCDLCHIANMNSLQEEFGSYIVNSCGEIDNDMLAEMPEEKYQRFLESVALLDTYPVIDDSELSRLEHEIHLEQIDNLIKSVEWELESEREIDNPDSEKVKSTVEELYWEKVSSGDIFIEHDYACVDEKAFVTECANLYQ